MLKDNDFRVRNNAASALCEYVSRKTTPKRALKRQFSAKDDVLIKYVSDRVFKSLPEPLCNAKALVPTKNQEKAINAVLGGILYKLTNLLLELDNKDQQVRLRAFLMLLL